MKNLPKKVYLQIDADGETPEDFKELSGVTWCSDKINENDIPYVLESPSPDNQEELWREAAYRLFIRHNPQESADSDIGQRLFSGFIKDMEHLSKQYTISKK